MNLKKRMRQTLKTLSLVLGLASVDAETARASRNDRLHERVQSQEGARRAETKVGPDETFDCAQKVHRFWRQGERATCAR